MSGEAALWSGLRERLAALTDAGHPPAFWLRDDDATAPTPALDRLLAVARECGVPLALAVIPDRAEAALAERLREEPDVAVLQHGIAHTDHAVPPAKKCELGPERPAEHVLAELAVAARRLDAFPRRLPVLVPPWNRIAPKVAAGLAGIGFAGLSLYGPRAGNPAAPGLSHLNTHLDLVAWREGGRFWGRETLLSQLNARLDAMLSGDADRQEPTGILTHHLVHGADPFLFLRDLVQTLREAPGCRWPSPEFLLALQPRAKPDGAA